jgi:hypothetical protein
MQIQAAILGRVPPVIVRMVAGWLLLLSGGAVLVDGGFTRNGVSPNADWWVIAFGLILTVAGGFLVRRTSK